MTRSGDRTGPTRTCVGCGRRDAQAVLTRLRRGVAGALVVGSRVGTGRSAYVHGQAECVQGLLRSKVLGKSLRTTVAREARIELMQALQENSASGTPTAARSGRDASDRGQKRATGPHNANNARK